MEWNKLPKSRPFKQYFGSYLIVFLVPVLLFTVIVSIIYVQTIEEEMSITNENILEQTNTQVTEQVTEMNSIGNQINHSRMFSPYFLNEANDYRSNIDNLKLYVNSTPYAKGIFVVLNNQSMVISHDGIISLDGLLSKRSEFDVVEDEKLIKDIQTPEQTISTYTLDQLNDSDGEKRVSFYMMPLEGQEDNYGTIMFVMETEQIQSILESVKTDNTGRVAIIIDDQDNLIYNNGDVEHLGALENVTEKKLNKSSQFTNNGYTLTSQQNQLTGWTFFTLVQTSNLYKPFYSAIFKVFIALSLFVLMGAIISVYFSVKNYKPLKQLLNTFSTKEIEIEDEWSYVQSNIIRKQNEYDLLYERIDEQTPIIRDSLLLNLLEGHNVVADRRLFNQLKEIDLTFLYKHFAVMNVKFGDKSVEAENIIEIENIAKKISGYVDSEFIFEATIPYLGNNQILIIVNLESLEESKWSDILEVIQTIINEANLPEKLNWKIAIGNTYNSISKINNSYIEASSALDVINSPKHKDKEVLFFSEINSQNRIQHSKEIFKYPEEEILVLLQRLKKGNQERALETLELILDKMSQKNLSNFAYQAIIADIFNTILKTAIELNLKAFDDINPEMTKLKDFSNDILVRTTIEKLIISICNNVKMKQENTSNQIEKHVVDYVYNNFDSPDISLEEIAAEYDISISYTSKLIKDETGDSFSNIIQELRMERFKELLIITDEPIKNLVKKIGYYDASNFTRKFRKKNNITPSEYRKTYKS